MPAEKRRRNRAFCLPTFLLALAIFMPALSVLGTGGVEGGAVISAGVDSPNVVSPGTNYDGNPLDDLDPTDRSQSHHYYQVEQHTLSPEDEPQVVSFAETRYLTPLLDWYQEAPTPPPDA